MTTYKVHSHSTASFLFLTAALTAAAQIRIPNNSGRPVALTADMTVVTISRTATGSFSQTEGGKFWRASDGRTRQDNASASLINDPIMGVTINLNHQDRSATLIQRTPLPPSKEPTGTGMPTAPPPETIQTKSGQTIEQLGERKFGDVTATGTRVTIPHAGGRLGSVTIESWTARELRLRLLYKETRIDGTTEQRYENVQLGEPSADVFQVPSGCSVRTAAMRKAQSPPGVATKK